MGAYDALIPGNAAAPTPAATGGKYASLIPQQTAPPPSTASLLGSNIGDALHSLGADVWHGLSAPFTHQSFNPTEATNAATNSFANTIQDAGNRLYNAVSTVRSDHATALQKGVSVGEAGMGAVNALFAPVSSALTYASHVPGVGYVADAFNKFFGAVGTVGGDAAGNLVNSLPLTDQQKATIAPLAQEVGSLAAQIATGKAGGDALHSLADKTHALVSSTAAALPVAKMAVEGNLLKDLPVQDQSPSTQEVPIANKYTPPEALPSIDMGPKAPDTLPTAERSPADQAAPPPANEQTIQADVPPARTSNTIRPVEGTGELKTSGLAQGIEAKAIEHNLSQGFGDLPEYRSVNMADQAAKTAKLIDTNYETARQIALGTKAPPKGLLPESVLVGVEKKAIDEGDIATLRELATNSRLTYQATTMGQRIRTLAERDPSSPVGAIKQVQDAREAALAAKNIDIPRETAKTVEEGRATVRKTASSIRSWNDLLDQITCKI